MNALLFFLLLASARSIELARHDLQSVRWGFRYYEDDPDLLDYAFWWKIQKFTGGNHIAWENVNRRVGETMTLTQENYGPTFNLFTRLLTDGQDYWSSFQFVHEIGNFGANQKESFVFADAAGSKNNIDLQGNHIDSVSVTFDVFDLVPNGTEWIEAEVSFTIVVSGRPELADDRNLAIITDDHDTFHCPYDDCNSTVWFSICEPAEEPLWWADLQFIFNLDETHLNGIFPVVAEYGNRPIQQLLTSGVDGVVTVGSLRYDGISRSLGTSKSVKFRGLPGVHNGVDFEFNLVEDISLAVNRSGGNSLQFSFAISGVLLEAPPDSTLPPAETPDSSGRSMHTLPCMVASVLALLTCWLY